jgi:hypothetical protein
MVLEFSRLATDERGITIVPFERPPVNAVSYQVYREIIEVADISARRSAGRGRCATRLG